MLQGVMCCAIVGLGEGFATLAGLPVFVVTGFFFFFIMQSNVHWGLLSPSSSSLPPPPAPFLVL